MLCSTSSTLVKVFMFRTHITIFITNLLLVVSGWFNWKRLGLVVMLLAGEVPAVPNQPKAFNKLSTVKFWVLCRTINSLF